MASVDDRLTALQKHDDKFTGIAFVQVIPPGPKAPDLPCDPFTLRIYFLTDVRSLTVKLTGGPAPLKAADFVIHEASGDPNVPNLPVLEIAPNPGENPDDHCLTFLDVTVQGPNDFRRYRLRIDDSASSTTPGTEPFPRIDPFFNDVVFSFQVGCDENLDCLPVQPECPVEEQVDFPVDYLARDFVSLRNALLDFAAHRYPEWQLPIEADVGSVLMEIFAALGDEFSYIQDRYAREAFLETATERRSLRKKARLLDYDIHDGRTATTLLEITAKGTGTQAITTHAQVWAFVEGGAPLVFEVGLGLRDPKLIADEHGTIVGYPLSSNWNEDQLHPYWLDKSKQCLDIGATDLFIDALTPGDVTEIRDSLKGGDRLMLLKTEPDDPSLPRRRHFVHLVDIQDAFDPLANGGTGQALTRLVWDKSDALPFQIDQQFLMLSLNIVPATAGEQQTKKFVCRPNAPPDADVDVAVEREGPLPLQLDPAIPQERPVIFLVGLDGTDTGGLGFLGPSLRETLPEVLIHESSDEAAQWDFTRSLLEQDADAPAFTLEDGVWRRIIAFRNGVDEFVHKDYAVGTGYTVRFGDGVFGRPPPEDIEFTIKYRLNPGALANVAPDTIVNLALPDGTTSDLAGIASAVTNPWPVLDGVDPESASDIKLLTPEAFRSDFFFAVTPKDYGVQMAKLPFVQRGHATLRWTGSWNTVFAAADPFDSFTLNDQERTGVEGWLDCVRQAGRDVVVKDPKFRTIDLEITICVQPFAYAGQVVRLVSEALLGKGGARPKKGFFDPDNFTFGTPLRRSALEAAIQEVPGVRAVLGIRVKSRGRFVFDNFDDLSLDIDPDEVIRLENDPVHPERGTLSILTEGGA